PKDARIILSGDQPRVFRVLNSLGSTFRRQLVEQPAGVCLDGVLAHEQSFGDFTIAESRCDRFQDLELAWSDAKSFDLCVVPDEWSCNRHGNFADNDFRARLREPEAQPDPERGKDERDQPSVDLERVLYDEKAVLDEFENDDEHAAQNSVEQNRSSHDAILMRSSRVAFPECCRLPSRWSRGTRGSGHAGSDYIQRSNGLPIPRQDEDPFDTGKAQ